MQKVFQVFNDPGHGWVKVPLTLLMKLGIIDKITTYSYMRGEFAYLEEDCDASTFFNAMKAKGIEPEWRSTTANKLSKIRGYASYSPSRAWQALGMAVAR